MRWEAWTTSDASLGVIRSGVFGHTHRVGVRHTLTTTLRRVCVCVLVCVCVCVLVPVLVFVSVRVCVCVC